ncbi:MAG TPA: hypothetical protein P5016_15420, partial [Verrucomicrobiales bacterium]|nr:hypothetical protein [Verrucomicrobiales bacterium]
MKPIILIAGLAVIGLAPHKTNAQVIVEDPAAIAQNAVQHAIDLGKYVEMISKQVEQINLLTSQLQQITAYVNAFGDPAALLQITGADNIISQLQQQPIGQLLGQLQETASGVQSLQNNANGLYRRIE